MSDYSNVPNKEYSVRETFGISVADLRLRLCVPLLTR